jgi:hypothetical protein
MHTVLFSTSTRHTAGFLLLTMIFVEYGGTHVLRMVRGSVPATDLQLRFSRAGHAHAAVLVILTLIALPYTDAAHLSGVWDVIARNGIWVAAILMPTGFFVAVAGRDVTRPNKFIALVWIGAISLTAALLTLGIGLLRS